MKNTDKIRRGKRVTKSAASRYGAKTQKQKNALSKAQKASAKKRKKK